MSVDTSRLLKAYFCPKCEIRFFQHECREGLPCGCGYSRETAPFMHIQRKAQKGDRGDLYRFGYKSFNLEAIISKDFEVVTYSERFIFTPSHKALFDYVQDKTQEIIEQDLILKAFIDAFYRDIHGSWEWFVRCGKCAHRAVDGGLEKLSVKTKKCNLNKFCIINCDQFKLDPEKEIKPHLEEWK